jgi:hypothetical protein
MKHPHRPRTAPPTRAASLCAVTLAFATLALAPSARAQRCDAGADGGVDPLLVGVLRDTFPADQGLRVPLDTPVRVRYFGQAPPAPTLCVRARDAAQCLAGSTVALADEVIWTGAAPLQPNTDYVVSFTDAAGGTNRTTFRTGRGPNAGPPVFNGLRTVSVDPAADPCDPNAADVTVRFDLAQNTGDGLGGTAWPDVDIEYIVYATRGSGVGGPQERERFRPQLAGGANDRSQQRTFRIPGAVANGPVCFLVRAVDPLGRSDGNTAERCVNPAEGNYFQGCAAGPSRRASGLGWALAAVGIAAIVRRRRRDG